MTRTLTSIQPQADGDDLVREAERRHGHVEVRRVAVVHPGDSHFKLLPLGRPLRRQADERARRATPIAHRGG